MYYDLTKLGKAVNEDLFSETLTNSNPETWQDSLQSKLEAQRNALGIGKLATDYSSNINVSSNLNMMNSSNASNKPMPFSIEGLQMAIDYWAKGKAPVTATDFLEVFRSTGVPVDLMLAQAVQESTVGTNGRRSIETKNMFNVGNSDDGSNRYMSTWKQGIYIYANLIKSKYALDPNNITAENIVLPTFVRVNNGSKSGARYASDPNYETKIMSIVNTIRKIIAKYPSDFSVTPSGEETFKGRTLKYWEDKFG